MGKDYAQVEYRGRSGITTDCLRALSNLLQESIEFEDTAHLLSSPLESDGCRDHALLLREKEQRSAYIIRVGFRSGYGGEGPRGLSHALCILRSFGLWVREVEVGNSMFERIEGSGLTDKDLDQLLKAPSHPWPRVTKYILHDNGSSSGLLVDSADVVIPLRVIDERLHDLVLKFWKDPDTALSKAYKRFEDIVRKRTGFEDVSSTLMKKAFLVDKAPLGWTVEPSERIGRANLFVGTFMAFRNPRAHKEDNGSHDEEYLAELLQINMLYRLEKQAINLNEAPPLS